MSYTLTFFFHRKRLLLWGSYCALAFLLPACGGGGGGGGGGNNGPMTEEERAQAELSPNNLDIPDTIVPETFQGKNLVKVTIDLEGNIYLGAQTKLHFELTPNMHDVSNSQLEYDGKRDISATWNGQSAGSGKGAIASLEISGTCSKTDEGTKNFSFSAYDITISSKDVTGAYTTYTATIGSGQCLMGMQPILSFGGTEQECTITYCIASTSSE